jgi:hypothetical protein
MNLKEFGVQVVRKTVIIALSIVLALLISYYTLSSFPDGM